jgi:hypothetical protein
MLRDFGDRCRGLFENFGVVDASDHEWYWITAIIIQLRYVNLHAGHQFNYLPYVDNASIHPAHQKHKLIHRYLNHFFKLTHIGSSINLPCRNFLRLFTIKHKQILTRFI